MAAKSITIEDTLIAIKSGIIPGCFSSDYKVFEFPTIKYFNKRRDPLEWSVEVRLKKHNKYVSIEEWMLQGPSVTLPDGYTGEIIVISYQVGGKIRKSVPTIVTSGKNIGRKNETNVLTQSLRDALSLYNKQLKTSVGDFDEKPPPMLIQWLDSSISSTLTPEDFKIGITAQRKYNGVRYVTYLNDNNMVVQYSRTGSDYYPAEYLNKELYYVLTHLPPIMLGKYGIETQEELNMYQNAKPYLDGELYLHGKSLSYISGQARKESDKDELNYYIFDVFFPLAISEGHNMISKHRQAYLFDLMLSCVSLKYIKRVDNFKVSSLSELIKLSEAFVRNGYEGAVARRDNKEYKYSFNNYHSSNVIKIKPIYSDEFKVVSFTEGKKGKDVNKIIWICEVNDIKDPNDTLFTVVPNLSLQDREKLFNCLSKMVSKKQTLFDRDIKGLPLTIEYSEISTKTGKPLQAKAIAFRTYEQDIDPIKKVFMECGL